MRVVCGRSKLLPQPMGLLLLAARQVDVERLEHDVGRRVGHPGLRTVSVRDPGRSRKLALADDVVVAGRRAAAHQLARRGRPVRGVPSGYRGARRR